MGLSKVSCLPCSPATLKELKDAIQLAFSGIEAEILHAAVIGVVTLHTCLLPCGGSHVEHLLF